MTTHSIVPPYKWEQNRTEIAFVEMNRDEMETL